MGAKQSKRATTTFTEPSRHGYLYAGGRVDPPSHAPVVRRSRRRDDALRSARHCAERLREHPRVVDVVVHEATFMPPLAGSPRCDVLVLVRTDTPEATAQVQGTDTFGQLPCDLVLAARNVRRIGDPDHPRGGTYLFNHFTADDADTAVEVWQGLADWYTTTLGVDNSALLQIEKGSAYALVNQVRLTGAAPAFLLNQLVRPSFHREVRGALREHAMRAMPVFYAPRDSDHG